jgi:5-methylcytosine-specific restriction endonuclease McrA
MRLETYRSAIRAIPSPSNGPGRAHEVLPSIHAPRKKFGIIVLRDRTTRGVFVRGVPLMPIKRAVDGLQMACSGCRRLLPRGQFCKNGDGRRAARCKDCRAPTDRANANRRRAVEMAAAGSFTAKDIERLKTQQHMACACGCGRSLYLGFHVDHVLPLARGGTNWPANLQLLSPVCNRTKGCRMPRTIYGAR